MKEERQAATGKGRPADLKTAQAKATPIAEIEVVGEDRRLTKIGEFDRVLGGGVIPGAVILIGGLRVLDDFLASDSPLAYQPQQVFQGAIADALTHVGQINFLRRMYGNPVRGENYFRAAITTGHVDADQPPPRSEFD